jgi:hypothetical protein
MQSARPKLITASTQISTEPVTIAGIVLSGGADASEIAIYNEATDDKTAAKKVMVVNAAIDTTVVIKLEQFLSEGCYVHLVSGTTPNISLLIR